MATLGVNFFLIISVIASLFRPWVGVVAVYLLVVLSPQNIWWWAFEGIRPIFYISVATIIGFLSALFVGKISLQPFFDKRIYCLLIMWIAFSISFYFGDYVSISSAFRFSDPNLQFAIINKILLFFLICCLCIDNQKKLKYLTLPIVISTIYLIYWTNNQYLFLGKFGRIGGPSPPYGGSHTYGDENNFAMLFVTGLPFLYYAGVYFKKIYLRFLFWAIIPLGWHAIFLTGSRGGLVALLTTLIITFIQSKRKIISSIILLFFLVFFSWQAGDIMKGRAQTIPDYQEDESVLGRIYSWEAAIKMIKDHPVIGVGFASFGPAYPDYSDNKPREAHSTFLQISAESGIIAGSMYILIVILYSQALLKTRNKSFEYEDKFLFFLNEALIASFAGIIVCSLFLSLQYFEIFYYICAMIHITAIVSTRVDEKFERPVKNEI